jgi:hypothetical protein
LQAISGGQEVAIRKFKISALELDYDCMYSRLLAYSDAGWWFRGVTAYLSAFAYSD